MQSGVQCLSGDVPRRLVWLRAGLACNHYIGRPSCVCEALTLNQTNLHTTLTLILTPTNVSGCTCIDGVVVCDPIP